jgi:DNA uptake protein ComE-like DNA-binding protein
MLVLVLAAAALLLPCHAVGAVPVATPPSANAPIDVNSASRARLKTLPGIGEVEADRIISGRPYLSKADLATREVLPQGLYFALKGRIIATQKPRAGSKVPPR